MRVTISKRTSYVLHLPWQDVTLDPVDVESLFTTKTYEYLSKQKDGYRTAMEVLGTRFAEEPPGRKDVSEHDRHP